MLEEFIRTLKSFLGVERTSFSIQDRWDKCPPKEAEGNGLNQYREKVSMPCSIQV
jgi:hypothetical protein